MGPTQVCVLLAATLALTVNASLLAQLGIPYATDGGSPAIKLHPAGIACFLAITLKFLSAGRRLPAFVHIVTRQRLLTAFIISLAACLVLEACMTGMGNLIVLLDTYVPAGMLAITLCDADDTERTQLRTVLQLGFAANALLAVGEAALRTNLFSPTPEFALLTRHANEFRPCALYDHPLTGAAMTAIGAFIAPRVSAGNLVHYGYLALMGTGLVAFGGRAAMAIAGSCLLCLGLRRLAVIILCRHCSLRLLTVGVAVILTVGLTCTAARMAGLGQRLAAHLYWDPSAQVRINQWHILELIDEQQTILGISRPDLLALLEPMRLTQGVPVIENFWLLMFLNLGLLGFPLFIAGFACLLIWCARQACGRALPLVVTTVAAASASNSLGRKSALLLVLVAAASSMARSARGRLTAGMRTSGGTIA